MSWLRVIFFMFCLISFYFGYVTYDSMFPDFEPWLWVFIPDCPLYVFLLLLIVLFDIKNDFVRFLVGVGLMKYGLWTLMIFALYPDVFFSGPYLISTSILVIGHLLMAASSFIIVPKKISLGMIVAVLAWFFANDYVDYWIGTMPIFPDTHIGIVIPASIGLSIFSVFVLYWLRGARDIEFLEWLRLELGVSK